MRPIAAQLGPVEGRCCRKTHREVEAAALHNQVVLGTALPPEGQVGAAGFIPLLTRALTLSAIARLPSPVPYQFHSQRQQIDPLP